MASIQDVPSELLREIFIPLSDTAKIPFDRNHPPWGLGHVCSKWRAISRSEPQLWGTPVFIPDESEPTLLRESFAALPEFVNISLTVRDMALQSDSQVVELYKYLPRCSELVIKIGRQSAQLVPFFRDLPRDAFVNLTKLKILLMCNSFPGRDNTEYWASMTHAFSNAKGLSSVTLMTDPLSAMTIASLSIPWPQVKFLTLQLPVQFPTLYALLHQCHSLASLRIMLPGNNGPYTMIPRPDLDSSFKMPHLRSLSIEHPASSWLPRISWHHLTDLDISSMEINTNTLQRTLEQCLHLRKLTLLLHPGFPERSLSLPLLNELDFTCSNHGECSLENIHVPRLQVLRISPSQGLDFPSLMNLLSRCSLLEFHYTTLHKENDAIIPLLRDILTLIPTASLVCIPGAAFDDLILRDIGDGTLLPNLREFGFIPKTIEAVSYLVKGWIRRVNKDPLHQMGLKIDASSIRPASVTFEEMCKEFAGLENVSIRWEELCLHWYMTVKTSISLREPTVDFLMQSDEYDFSGMFLDLLL